MHKELPQCEPLVVALTSMAGERFMVPALPVDATVRSFKEAVRLHKGTPIAAQRFILDGQLLEASDCQPLGPALGRPRGGLVEVSFVHGALPEEAQRVVDGELLCAAARGDAAAIRSCLADGAAVASEATGTGGAAHGLTPLLLALASGEEEAVRVLREAGAPTPDLRPRCHTLGQAFARAHLGLADAARLLHRGADPNTRLRRGQGIQDTTDGTPLHACCALRVPGVLALAELLLRLGANPDSPDHEGDSPLAHAQHFDAQEMQALLRARGAKLAGPYYSMVHVTGRRLLGWR